MDEPLLPADAAGRKRAVGGILLLALGVGATYFFALRPLAQLQSTGHTSYYIKGVLLGPVCIYAGVLAMTGRFADGQIRKQNARGKPTFTTRGWIAIGGALIVMALTLAAWYGYLHSLGYVESGG